MFKQKGTKGNVSTYADHRPGCPFKAVCSNGDSLVQVLDKVVHNLEMVQLASKLREGTKESHTQAESRPYIKRFRKQLTKDQYARYIANLCAKCG